MPNHELISTPRIGHGMLPEHSPPPRGKIDGAPLEGDDAGGRPDVLIVGRCVGIVVVVVDVVGIVEEEVGTSEDYDAFAELELLLLLLFITGSGLHLAVEHDAIVRGRGHAVKVQNARHVVGSERPQCGPIDVVFIVRARWSAVDPRYVPRGRMLRVGDGGYPLNAGAGGTGGHHGFQDVLLKHVVSKMYLSRASWLCWLHSPAQRHHSSSREKLLLVYSLAGYVPVAR
mmetsp:Transcript_27896/g.61196  ORF Transcript_27896/g.61196 Transcript_27896/m.61196 type:complete len:229 (-) Transcript_27896:122-808(-)